MALATYVLKKTSTHAVIALRDERNVRIKNTLLPKKEKHMRLLANIQTKIKQNRRPVDRDVSGVDGIPRKLQEIYRYFSGTTSTALVSQAQEVRGHLARLLAEQSNLAANLEKEFRSELEIMMETGPILKIRRKHSSMPLSHSIHREWRLADFLEDAFYESIDASITILGSDVESYLAIISNQYITHKFRKEAVTMRDFQTIKL